MPLCYSIAAGPSGRPVCRRVGTQRAHTAGVGEPRFFKAEIAQPSKQPPPFEKNKHADDYDDHDAEHGQEAVRLANERDAFGPHGENRRDEHQRERREREDGKSFHNLVRFDFHQLVVRGFEVRDGFAVGVEPVEQFQVVAEEVGEVHAALLAPELDAALEERSEKMLLRFCDQLVFGKVALEIANFFEQLPFFVFEKLERHGLHFFPDVVQLPLVEVDEMGDELVREFERAPERFFFFEVSQKTPD